MGFKKNSGKTLLGWCSGHQPAGAHERCIFELVVPQGVHLGKLMVCECDCHEGREVDYSKYPVDIVLFKMHTAVPDDEE